jgi:protein SCO1/2
MLQNLSTPSWPKFAELIMKKKWFYIIFFVSLALLFYFILTLLIPGFGQKRTPPVSSVRPFTFLNQDGDTVTEKNVLGKVYVAEYFFTHCTGICPTMNENMKTVYESMAKDTGFLILSHTSDPERDSVAQMKYYADSVLKVDTRRWLFLTGEKQKLYDAARFSYTIDDPANNLKSIDDQFVHSQYWALVDRKGDVRKVYDGMLPSEAKKLVKDARRLLKEKP